MRRAVNITGLRWIREHGDALHTEVSDIPSWVLWSLPVALIGALVAVAH